MTRTSLDYVEDILDAMKKCQSFVAGMSYEDFLGDEKTTFAVTRALEIIGEATKRVPDDVRRRYPAISWREMARMRNRVIHGYFGVNLEVVWRTITEDVPGAIPHVESALAELTADERRGQ